MDETDYRKKRIKSVGVIAKKEDEGRPGKKTNQSTG